MEKLPSKQLYGQHLVVLPYTKQSLAKFEEATKRADQQVMIFFLLTITPVFFRKTRKMTRAAWAWLTSEHFESAPAVNPT